MPETTSQYELLPVFIAVADSGSFTKAARKLGIGKATVSRAIAELERRLGAELLHRTTRAVSLSTAGLALYERTAAHVTALQQALLKVPERAAEPSGVLRITAPHDIGCVVLPEILVQFARRYPAIHVDVRLTNQRVDLVAEGFDLAIRASGTSLKDSSLIARKLADSAISFYASPGYIARRGKPKQPDDPQHEWILHAGLRAAFQLRRDMPARFVCDDLLLVRELVREGAGVGMLPPFVAAPYVREGSLEQVTFAALRRDSGGLYLVYPSRGQVPRKVTAFRDFLLERLPASLSK
jgi:DNA-binding transcriptional LysR family regulator